MSYLPKVISGFLLAMTALTASAHDGFRGNHFGQHGYPSIQGHYNGYRGGYYNNYQYHNDLSYFVAPALIGGIIGYGLAQPRVVTPTTLYSSPPITYTQPPVIYDTPQPMVYSAPIGYHYENILDANCNCYRTVLVANQ